MESKKILFVCIHNSARSVMAEAFINRFCGGAYHAESAGIEPGTLNPIVAEAMAEIGVDVSGHQPRAVADVIESGQQFDLLVTVCDETSAERCPFFPGVKERLHWGFSDPSSFEGSREEKLARTRLVRDEIQAQVNSWCNTCCPTKA